MAIVDTSYLNTLPQNQMKSGLAEMLKHGLIANENYWQQLIKIEDIATTDLNKFIYESILIKKAIVEEDINEDGIRKALNYGHTIGHALETYSLSNKSIEPLLHGEAIAIGIVIESYISTHICGFSNEKCTEIKNAIKRIYPKVIIPENSFYQIITLTSFDKKNSHGNVNYVLLEKIGKPKLDCFVENEMIIKGFNFYNS